MMFEDDDIEHPHEECGVFAIYAPERDVARAAYFGLFALQHRGQESAGIAVADGKAIHAFKEMGLVNQVFDEQVIASLKGHIAIGHTRYSTTGGSMICNAQPLLATDEQLGQFALAHNGNLANASALRARCSVRSISTTWDMSPRQRWQISPTSPLTVTCRDKPSR